MYVGSPPGSSYSDYAIIPIGTSLRKLQLFFLVFLMYEILTRMHQIHSGESLVVGRLSVTRSEGCNREAAKCCTYSSGPAPLSLSYLNSSSPPRNPAPETGEFSNTFTSSSACFPRAALSNNRAPIFRQLFCCDALMSKRDCQQAWS